MSLINITLPDGNSQQYQKGITTAEIITEAYPNIKSRYVAVKIDGDIRDLAFPITKDAALELLTCNDPEGMQVFWHSASHIMAQAVISLFPGTQLGIGPSISNGFYYDFSLDSSISEDDLSRIEEKMQEIVKADQPFVREELSKQEALELFKQKEDSFKLDLLKEIPGDSVSIYKNGEFYDLCRGPHLPSTGYVKHFKLLSLAGAYWHGDERNPMMQRIYGVAFPDKKQLKTHLLAIEEAKKRDHRKLGKALDLFSFQPEGPGFAFWHHNGMIVYNQAVRYLLDTLTRHGYEEIKTPIILNEELWHRSGHWDNYKNNMYFTTIDEQAYAVKPMNCPGGLLVFKNQPHSYRDLPVKMAELGLVHRHEKSGVLHGLFRVRQFTQDDAHVFCTPDQLEDEIVNLIDLIAEIYGAFGFDDYQLELSTRPEKSIGSSEMWERAENALRHALEKKEIDYTVSPGEGAFYGPKIDYHIRDSLGRMWQCGTIQVDFSMPERFGLEYVGQDGEKHRPVMIHRAILGSIERFLGILIEHYGGAFPAWLAPVQCLVIPISEKHLEYAQSIHERMQSKGLRSKVDARSEKVGYKIREAEKKKTPYMCIVGDEEVESQTLSVRKRRKGQVGGQDVDQFIKDLSEEIERRINH